MDIFYFITCYASCWLMSEIVMFVALLFPVFVDGWKAFELELFLGLSMLITLGATIMCILSCVLEKYAF